MRRIRMSSTANLDIWLLVLVFGLVLTEMAVADAHYVSPGQDIQAAIDDANDYDEIDVAPGIYYEAIDFKGKVVRL